jgi:hypothetical protein
MKRPVAAAVRAEQLAGRARVAAVREALAGRVHACVGEGAPQLPRVGGERRSPVERLGRERVLVAEALGAQRLERERVAARPRAVPVIEELVDGHPLTVSYSGARNP